MRIVIKIGTNLLTKDDNSLNEEYIANIADQIGQLKKQGHEIIFVSSGATTAGRSKLKTKKESKNIPFKQALAAVGQGLLMHLYKNAFRQHSITIAQVLLTNNDFSNRTKYLNILHTLELLLRLDVLPILNENDVTSIKEFAIGENDILSAQVSAMVSADLLVILTTVDGLYTGMPGKDPDVEFISEVTEITPAIKQMAKGSGSKNSRGGMATKVIASEFATQSGVPVVIAHGREKDILKRIVIDSESVGTSFPTTVSKLESRKIWLRHNVSKDCSITIDHGAKKAITVGKKSLLPAGITSVSGDFIRGDVIHILDDQGHKIGIGRTNYSSKSLGKIKGCQSNEIGNLLPKAYEDEVIHRDELVILDK